LQMGKIKIKLKNKRHSKQSHFYKIILKN